MARHPAAQAVKEEMPEPQKEAKAAQPALRRTVDRMAATVQVLMAARG